MVANKWSISVYQGSSPFDLKPAGERVPILTPEGVTDMECETVADPFLLVHNSQWHMFFEALNAETGRGEIAHASGDTGLDWTYQGVVLREPFHLSYPHVFEHAGVIYMVPETRQAGCVRLYAATAFPGEWELVRVIVDAPLADPTPFFRHGTWWMFAHHGLDELRLYTSSRLQSGWQVHPRSPIWRRNRVYSRPGGRVLVYRGDWYRLAQDGLLSYGNNLRALKIKVLSETAYEEEECLSSPILAASTSGWNSLGMHHLDAVAVRPDCWIGAVDGVTAKT